MSDIPKRLVERWLRARGAQPAWVIEAGTPGDYLALERFHYCAGAPATWAGVLAARAACDGELAGVLVVSRPTLNGWWRELAWPGVYGGGDRTRAAIAINAGLRTISRVVVDPRWRGMGVGVALVRAYLASPLTRDTEAVAAMGRICPIFERAGMTRHERGMSEQDRGLLRELRGAGVDVGRLVEARYAQGVLARRRVRAHVEAWARRSGATRGLLGEGAGCLGAMVASRVLWRAPAYVAGGGVPNGQNVKWSNGQIGKRR